MIRIATALLLHSANDNIIDLGNNGIMIQLALQYAVFASKQNLNNCTL